MSVFQGADPELAGQRDLPLSQVPDAGRERARLAMALDQTDQAGPLIADAVQLSTCAEGADTVDTWLLQIDQAHSGRHAEARALAQQIAHRLAPAIDPEGRWAAELRILGATP